MSNLLQTAINSALSQDWKKAISANQDLLSENSEDLNSMNRLAYAYIQIGKIDEARKLYKRILAKDKYNNIAIKNLSKLNALPKSLKSVVHKSSSLTISPSLFIEEPGKTKTINLINIAPPSILSNLSPGAQVFFHPKKHAIDVRTDDKVYLGALPDDFAFKLLRFIKAGYEYNIHVKNSTKNSVSVFICETNRAKRFKSQPSFLMPNSSVNKITLSPDRKLSEMLSDDDEKEANQDESDE